MDDLTLLALCVWSESRGEPDDGKAAVARVVLNRKRLRYTSDGTMVGTVLAKDQFSGFWFDMVDGKYARVCHTLEDAQARAGTLLAEAIKTDVWSDCRGVATDVTNDSYVAADGYTEMTDEVVLYLNPAIINPAHMPSWASAENRVCTIGHHEFFKA